MNDKVKVADKTVRSFTSVADWMGAAQDSGLRVKLRKDDNDEVEYFAEKECEEDVTMIGYFKDDWGMLV